MKKIAIIFAFLFAFCQCPYSAFADISVTLNLDRNEARLPDTIRMTISIKGTRKTDLEPVIYGLESFNVMRSGTSSRVEFINGSLSSGVDYQYSIQPQKAGTFKIGPVEVKSIVLSEATGISNGVTPKVAPTNVRFAIPIISPVKLPPNWTKVICTYECPAYP